MCLLITWPQRRSTLAFPSVVSIAGIACAGVSGSVIAEEDLCQAYLHRPKPECLAVMLYYKTFQGWNHRPKQKNKRNIIIMSFIVFGFVFDNEGFGTQDREDMQAYLPVFPPLFPGYGVELCLFEVSHTTKQRDATRCVDVPGIKESFYLGCGVELCLLKFRTTRNDVPRCVDAFGSKESYGFRPPHT